MPYSASVDERLTIRSIEHISCPFTCVNVNEWQIIYTYVCVDSNLEISKSYETHIQTKHPGDLVSESVTIRCIISIDIKQIRHRLDDQTLT